MTSDSQTLSMPPAELVQCAHHGAAQAEAEAEALAQQAAADNQPIVFDFDGKIEKTGLDLSDSFNEPPIGDGDETESELDDSIGHLNFEANRRNDTCDHSTQRCTQCVSGVLALSRELDEALDAA